MVSDTLPSNWTFLTRKSQYTLAENRSIVGQLTYMIRQLPAPVSDEDEASRETLPEA